MIHGFEGEPNGGWRPWLMGELAKKDIYACALPMPTPDKPEKNEWIKVVSDSVRVPTEEIFLIGHSLGVPTILRYLETLPEETKIGGAILIAGPAFVINKSGYEKVNVFLKEPFDFGHIKNACKKFAIIHGDNDTAVLFSDAEYLAKNLSCSLISIKNGKHLAGHDGFYELPEALEEILKMVK